MKRITMVLIAALVLALVPIAAGAQTVEQVNAAVDDVKLKLDALGGETVEEWTASAEALKASVANLKAVAGDLDGAVDYAELDAAVAALDAAITGGDLAEIAVAGEAVAAAGAGVVAAAGGGTPAAGGVDTGDAVNSGPNLVLLGVALMLALTMGGALVLRRANDRR
jgi:formate hydrogenlyase subunit 3/multisubunit Na+/H+ antiporter MnhD subunit